MAVFTKRRYRDRWNRTVTRRIAKRHNHALKIKAKVRGGKTYPEKRIIGVYVFGIAIIGRSVRGVPARSSGTLTRGRTVSGSARERNSAGICS